MENEKGANVGAIAIRQTDINEQGKDTAQPVSDYYNLFRREPSPLGPMQIDRVVVIKDINFEKLVDQMLGLRQKEYLVVAHGSRFGFFMPLVGQDGTSAMALDLGKGGDGPLKHLND